MNQELDIYIRARYPLIWVVTPEETRAMQELIHLAEQQRKRLLAWSITTGLINPATPDRVDTAKRDPLALLTSISEDSEPCIWILRDFHPFLRIKRSYVVCAKQLSP